MRCIEMPFRHRCAHTSCMINRNMRCIEIPIFFGLHQHLPRLIETWDVLKFRCRANPPRESRSCRGGQKAEINRNMGCIEIFNHAWLLIRILTINRNMGCIEISQSFLLARSTCWINRNMRCIEILQYFEVSYLNKKQYFKILHQRLYGISKI